MHLHFKASKTEFGFNDEYGIYIYISDDGIIFMRSKRSMIVVLTLSAPGPKRKGCKSEKKCILLMLISPKS